MIFNNNNILTQNNHIQGCSALKDGEKRETNMCVCTNRSMKRERERERTKRGQRENTDGERKLPDNRRLLRQPRSGVTMRQRRERNGKAVAWWWHNCEREESSSNSGHLMRARASSLFIHANLPYHFVISFFHYHFIING